MHARLTAHLVRVMDRMRETIAQAQAEGDLDESIDPEELTRMFLFLFRGMSIRVPGFPVPLPDMEAVLGLLRPRSTARSLKKRGARR
jgi:hypothetical protein